MARVSHALLGTLNVVTLLLSLPVLCAGVFFHMRAATECERALQVPVILLGCALLLLSLLGLVGACGRRSRGAATPFLWAYVVLMFLLVVAVFAFTVFAFVVTDRSAATAVSGRGYKEYRLGDYSGWLRARIAEPDTWRRVESCITEAGICTGRLDGAMGRDAMEFYRRHLSPIQSGCCKPQERCGFRHVNATFWAPPIWGSPSAAAAAADGDCMAWSNDQQVLCLDCDACKAGVLEVVQKKWKMVAIGNVALLVILVVVYTLGCCALRNNGGSRYSGDAGANQT